MAQIFLKRILLQLLFNICISWSWFKSISKIIVSIATSHLYSSMLAVVWRSYLSLHHRYVRKRDINVDIGNVSLAKASTSPASISLSIGPSMAIRKKVVKKSREARSTEYKMRIFHTSSVDWKFNQNVKESHELEIYYFSVWPIPLYSIFVKETIKSHFHLNHHDDIFFLPFFSSHLTFVFVQWNRRICDHRILLSLVCFIRSNKLYFFFQFLCCCCCVLCTVVLLSRICDTKHVCKAIISNDFKKEIFFAQRTFVNFCKYS